jgi:hypothetical protein
MLQQRNSYRRVIKLRMKRLTLQGRLSSLGSTKAGFWLLWLNGWICVGLLGGSAGCATGPATAALTKDSPPEVKRAVLTERINARWDALIKGDLDRAYTFMSQASKDAYPLSVYKAKVHPGMWRSVKIEGIECEVDICKASLQLTYDHRVMKGITTPLLEVWTIDQGNAWFVYQPAG